MDRVTDGDIPPALSDRLDSLLAQRAEETRRTIQEKALKNYKFATEQQIRDFHSYKRDADFIAVDMMSTIRIMEGSTYARLYVAMADRLNVMPCDIRIWIVENVEKTFNLRVVKHICLDTEHDDPIEYAKFYVEDLTGMSASSLTLLFLLRSQLNAKISLSFKRDLENNHSKLRILVDSRLENHRIWRFVLTSTICPPFIPSLSPLSLDLSLHSTPLTPIPLKRPLNPSANQSLHSSPPAHPRHGTSPIGPYLHRCLDSVQSTRNGLAGQSPYSIGPTAR